jgi:hypothetical protein
MAPERRHGRSHGKSDPIDALAVARAAIREPALGRPLPDEEPYRELKLLVDHRDAIVEEQRRVHERLRRHLHQIDPTYEVPCGGLPAPCSSNASRAGSPAKTRRPAGDNSHATAVSQGKSRREAIRCLKRLLVRVVFQTLKNEPGLDIGTTLAQARVASRGPRRAASGFRF